MSIQTIDERVRANRRKFFKEQIDGAIKGVGSLISNTSAIKDLKYQGKDITDLKLLEILAVHIAQTQSMQQEENAVSEFMEQWESAKKQGFANIQPSSTMGKAMSGE